MVVLARCRAGEDNGGHSAGIGQWHLAGQGCRGGGSRETKLSGADNAAVAFHLIHHVRHARAGSVLPFIPTSKAMRRMQEFQGDAAQLQPDCVASAHRARMFAE